VHSECHRAPVARLADSHARADRACSPWLEVCSCVAKSLLAGARGAQNHGDLPGGSSSVRNADAVSGEPDDHYLRPSVRQDIDHEVACGRLAIVRSFALVPGTMAVFSSFAFGIRPHFAAAASSTAAAEPGIATARVLAFRRAAPGAADRCRQAWR
jgi:hypothetical protein